MFIVPRLQFWTRPPIDAGSQLLVTMQRFIILTLGRSGSNHWVSLVNEHPRVLNYGEVLGDYTPHERFVRPALRRSNAGYVDSLLSSRAMAYLGQGYSAVSRIARGERPRMPKRYSELEAVGLKDFSQLVERRELADHLLEVEDLKVISLLRRDVLRRFISLERLHAGGAVANRGGAATEGPTLTLDRDHTLEQLDIFAAELDYHERLVGRFPDGAVLELEYETVFRSSNAMERATAEVFEFLGVEPLEVRSPHRKLTDDDLRAVVANYDEMVEWLTGTPYERFLAGVGS